MIKPPLVETCGLRSEPDGPVDSWYWWPVGGSFGKDRSGPYPTEALALAAAREDAR